jgi:hypothetical protein
LGKFEDRGLRGIFRAIWRIDFFRRGGNSVRWNPLVLRSQMGLRRRVSTIDVAVIGRWKSKTIRKNTCLRTIFLPINTTWTLLGSDWELLVLWHGYLDLRDKQ